MRPFISKTITKKKVAKVASKGLTSNDCNFSQMINFICSMYKMSMSSYVLLGVVARTSDSRKYLISAVTESTMFH